MSDHLTIGDVARSLSLPLWKVRSAVDSLDVEFPRAGLYRLIPRSSLPLVVAELRRRGWLPTSPEVTSA